MVIVIDNSSASRIIVHVHEGGQWQEHVFDRPVLGGVLGALSRLLPSPRSRPVAGLAVLVGEGSFTSVRVAVTVANMLAYARGIPVAVYRGGREAALAALAHAVPGVYATPGYSHAPRVGN